jgi:ribonuclease BN (tRNA processing enzyme)
MLHELAHTLLFEECTRRLLVALLISCGVNSDNNLQQCKISGKYKRTRITHMHIHQHNCVSQTL